MDVEVFARENMQKVLDLLMTDLATVRTGRATSSLIENIIVTVYAGSTSLTIKELATIATADPQTLVLTPFDPSIAGEIQKGILEANVGLNPSCDGQIIRISIPPLSEERRRELIHLMRQKLESGRIMVRQARHEAMAQIKKDFESKAISEDDRQRLEKQTQIITDEFVSHIDSLGAKKEEELMQI